MHMLLLRPKAMFATIFRRLKSSCIQWLRNRKAIHELRKSALFDRDYYLDANPEVRAKGLDPIVHYCKYGWREGKCPNPLFDSAWYLRRYPEVKSAGVNPLLHFIRHGARELRNPGPNFETRFYIETCPEVLVSGINPLLHYLTIGQYKGLLPHSRQVSYTQPKAPPQGAWMALTGLRGASQVDAAVDVIIPVYRGFDDTMACIYSVLTAPVRTKYELVVCNDCSPDKRITSELRRLAATGIFTLVENDANLGFVQTVNRGMLLHPNRDVILLNSDTVVYNDWLDRILAHAAASTKIGTITPLSNNATICSYPVVNADNHNDLELSFADLDSIAAHVNKGRAIPIPTAVGFCMYIRRACLDQVGLFDAKTFGRGYGEENDFCMRATAAGWLNMLAADVFVRHTGEVSFAHQATASKRDAMRKINARHPTYSAMLSQYNEADPARAARAAIDLARLLRVLPTGRCHLLISHNRGGGTERCIKERVKNLAEQGIGALWAIPTKIGGLGVTLMHPGEVYSKFPNISGLELRADCAALKEIIGKLGVERIEVHSLLDFNLWVTATFLELTRALGLEYDIMIHDYALLCPTITLIDDSGFYCGGPAPERCERCKAIPPDAPSPAQLHTAYHGLLVSAARVMAPSKDAAKRITMYFPNIRVDVVPHNDSLIPERRPKPAIWSEGEPIRIGIIGGIAPHKGVDVLFACAQRALADKLNIEFVVIGYTSSRILEALENVTVTGAYVDESVPEIISQLGLHGIFLPSVWPETYMYTLTYAIEGGFPTLVFDLGAQGERISGYDRGVVLPLSAARSPKLIIDTLVTMVKNFSLQSRPEE
jgi:GT2 family glycosyltransferase/glycosyltransferase involved in cell wall biosynthesis